LLCRAEKEAKREEKLLIKEIERNKREAEKEKKRMERELQKEKGQTVSVALFLWHLVVASAAFLVDLHGDEICCLSSLIIIFCKVTIV
jgi:Flp pilus assembly protein TadB